jgi:hypothetical protein
VQPKNVKAGGSRELPSVLLLPSVSVEPGLMNIGHVTELPGAEPFPGAA